MIEAQGEDILTALEIPIVRLDMKIPASRLPGVLPDGRRVSRALQENDEDKHHVHDDL